MVLCPIASKWRSYEYVCRPPVRPTPGFSANVLSEVKGNRRIIMETIFIISVVVYLIEALTGTDL